MSLTNAPTISNINENWLFQFTADNETCLSFDGTNDKVAYGNILATYVDFTVEFWVKADSVSGTDYPIFHRSGGASEDADDNNSIIVSLDGPEIQVFYEYGSGSNVSLQTGSSGFDSLGLSANTWTHIAAVRSSVTDDVKIYKNGTLVSTMSSTASANDPSGADSSDMAVNIGTNYANNKFFAGELAHVRVWSMARDASQIAKHYQTSIDSSASNLVGYWKFNEGSETTAYDSSANSNNGTISGATFLTHEFDKYILSFGLSFRDTTVDNNFYHGSVLNRSISIRESIDITKGTANTSNISITSANFKIKGTEFYKTLFNYAGTNFINKTVVVYSQFFNNTGLSNCQKIFIGRLVDLKLNQNGNVTFQVNTKRPWDGISFPQTQTTNGIYQPVVYGDYTAHSDQSLVREHDNAVYPVPFKRKGTTTDHLIVTPTTSTNILPHYYDSTLDGFLGIKADNYVAQTKDLSSDFDDNTNIGLVKREMRRRFRVNPLSLRDDETTTFSTAKNLLLDSYNAQGATHTISASSDQAKNIYVNFGAELSKVNDIDLDIKGSMVTAPSQPNTNVTLRVNYSGTNKTYMASNLVGGQNFSLINSNFGSLEQSESSSSYSKEDLTNIDHNNLNSFNFSSTLGPASTGTVNATITISDMVLYLDVQQSYDEDTANTNNSISSVQSLKYLYLATDGLTASWDSGAISHGHDAHRDLLQRFAGISSSDPVGWSDLNTDRAIDNWGIRYWQLEPVKLKDKLDKLAYEFGFVAKYTATEELKYIYVKKTSELSATLNLTKDDITNVNIATTGINNLVTEMKISNKLHPAVSNRYYNTVTANNSTLRRKYNLTEKENIQSINLDAHVGAIPTNADADCNADFYSYYNNIVGDIKMLVSCDIVNPVKGYALETGDIITFTDMPVELFNTSFTASIFFMIVEYKRSPGKVSITAREVG